MKNFILCKRTTALFSLLLATFCHCNILRLNEKPQAVSVYKWCKQQAKNLVKAKKNKLLQMFNISSQEEWQIIQENLAQSYSSQADAKESKKFIPDYIKICIHNLLENPEVRRKFNITRVIETHKKITALTFNQKNIHFVITNENTMMETSGRTIFINPTLMRDFSRSDREIEASIGHELGHLLRGHHFEDYCFIEIWKKQAENLENAQEQQLLEAIYEFRRAYEIEADIIGTFNNLHLALAGHTLFLNLARTQPFEKDKNHPSDQKRANYLKTIQQYIKMEIFPTRTRKRIPNRNQLRHPPQS